MLTLEQTYYVAELVGVIAVVASLIYVGLQLKQNTDAMKVSAASSQVQMVVSRLTPFMFDRDATHLWVKGGAEFASLDDIDKRRVLLFETSAIAQWNHAFQLRSQGLMPDAPWREQLWAFENMGKRQSIREAWISYKDAYDPAFQEFMREYLE